MKTFVQKSLDKTLNKNQPRMQMCSDCGKKCRATLNMCPTCYPKPAKQRLVGSTWIDEKGRTWEVVEMASVGIYMVRTTDLSRVGEMTAASIRAAIAKATKSL